MELALAGDMQSIMKPPMPPPYQVVVTTQLSGGVQVLLFCRIHPAPSFLITRVFI